MCVTTDPMLISMHDYYNDQALVITDGAGSGSCAKVIGYEYNADMCVFYIDVDMSNLLDLTSVVKVVPALGGLTRTDPQAHSAGKVDVYRAGPLGLVDKFAYFSGDEDLSLEDVIRKIARHSGVTYMAGDFANSEIFRPYQKSSMVAPGRRSFIFSLYGYYYGLTGTVDFHFRMPSPPRPAQIRLFALRALRSLIGLAALFSPRSRLARHIPYHLGLKISMYDRFISIWLGDRLIHTFVLTDTDGASTSTYHQFYGTETEYWTLLVQEACMRIDNFTIDMGKTGISVVQQILGNRKYFVMDNNAGLLVLRKEGEVVNSEESPHEMIVSGNTTKIDPPFTRIYLEGGEVVEANDPDNLKKYGNLFHRATIQEINDTDDAQYFATLFMDDAGTRIKDCFPHWANMARPGASGQPVREISRWFR